MKGFDLAKLSLQSQARWWSWRSLVFTRVGACPLVLPQVINLAGICTDKISLMRRRFLVPPQVINLAGICIDKISLRRGKPVTFSCFVWNQLLETCLVNLQCSLAHFQEYKRRPEFQLQLNSTIKCQMSPKR